MRNLFFIILPFFCLFYAKYKISECNQYNKALAKKVITYEENIKILRAEWAFLNSPRRLKRLAVEELGMQPASIQQMVPYKRWNNDPA